MLAKIFLRLLELRLQVSQYVKLECCSLVPGLIAFR